MRGHTMECMKITIEKKNIQTMNVSHDMNKTTLFELDEKKT